MSKVVVDIDILKDGLKGVFITTAKIFDAIGAEDAAAEITGVAEAAVDAADNSSDSSSDSYTDSSSDQAEKEAPSKRKSRVKTEPVESGNASEAPESDSKASDSSDKEVTTRAEKTPQEATEEQETASKDATESGVALDDITKVIVAKIKLDRSNNAKIGSILKNYGVAKVSLLPKDKYADFLAEISSI